ncbi:unnamed protein product [Ceutorhynchus assimilis]|uniref:Transposase domain-containing protein n=1 Tax=Ceutorhynchus assimilis TaxID=467358 RepID=A0A9P0DL27_9CUCU|nr:unnamed protein product [Ceutorhynchus assimilis]
MGNGQFWYNGIENCLLTKFADIAPPQSVCLVFNVDGLPPFRGSSIEFWPILFKIENMPRLQPMVVAIYCGETKPPLQKFLTQFVDELNHILKNGVIVEKCKLEVKIKYFVCDTPARNFIKGTVGFNSAHGCIKCTVIGDYDRGGRHMSFPRIDCPLRTDESFRMKTDDGHHKEDSPLLRLPINMVEDIIVADSLHLFDLGLMRKCLYGWVNGSYNFRTKLSAAQIDQLSYLLEECNKRRPIEIHRAIRKLKCLKYWKGTEYRTFLLYIGPVILKVFLTREAYHNFLTLCCAVTILSCNTYSKYIHIAECLLEDFIEQFIDIYGIDAISSNVHNACHVVNDVKKFGSLPEISSYPFENFLGHLKTLLHTGNRQLPQLAKRVIELSKFNSLSI